MSLLLRGLEERRQVLVDGRDELGHVARFLCGKCTCELKELNPGTDLLFDVRFLPNPHYEPELRPLTGRDASVVASS